MQISNVADNVPELKFAHLKHDNFLSGCSNLILDKEVRV